MPLSPSSNRYSPLDEQDEVRIEMEERPQTEQATEPQWQDSTREALAMALGTNSRPPVSLETKPPPRRGMSWPIFTLNKPVDVQGELHERLQKKRAASLPDLRQKPALEEVSVDIHSHDSVLISIRSTKWNRGSRLGPRQIQLRQRHLRKYVSNVFLALCLIE